jgi:hypothetical protein
MMNIQECVNQTQWQLDTPQLDLSKDITGAYAGDLLSWVMGRGNAGDAWVTVQVHVNVLAVAVLREFSCVIIADNAVVTEEFIKKASDEGLVIIESKMPTYETAVKLHELGI